MKDQKTNWLAFSSIGFQITASLLVFGWIGRQLDIYLSINPYGLILGLLLGGFFGLYQIWKALNLK